MASMIHGIKQIINNIIYQNLTINMLKSYYMILILKHSSIKDISNPRISNNFFLNQLLNHIQIIINQKNNRSIKK